MQYKFIPVVPHLVLISEKSMVDDGRQLWWSRLWVFGSETKKGLRCREGTDEWTDKQTGSWTLARTAV